MEYLYNLGKISRALDPFDQSENHQRIWQMNEIAKHYATRSIKDLRRQPICDSVEDIASSVYTEAYSPSVYFSGGLVGGIAKKLFAPQRRPDYDRLNHAPQIDGYEALATGYREQAHSNGTFYARFVLKMADPFWLLCPDVSHNRVISRSKYLELYSNGNAVNSMYHCFWFDKSLLPASVLLFDKVLSGSVDKSGATAALATLIEAANERIGTSTREIDQARHGQNAEKARNLERELAKELFEMTVRWGAGFKMQSTPNDGRSKHKFRQDGQEKFLAFEECVALAAIDIFSHSEQWESVQTKRSLFDCVGSFYDFESRVSAAEQSAVSDIQNWISCIPDTHELIRTYWYDKAPSGRKRKTKKDLGNDISSVIEGIDSTRDDFNGHIQLHEVLPDDTKIDQSLDVEVLIRTSLNIEAERHPDLDWNSHIPIFEFILDQWNRGYGYGPSRSEIGRGILEKLGGISVLRKVAGVPRSIGKQKKTIAGDIVSVLHDWITYLADENARRMKSHDGRYLDKCVQYEMPGRRSPDGDSWILAGNPSTRKEVLEYAIQILSDSDVSVTGLSKSDIQLVVNDYIPTALYAVYAERLATDHYRNSLATSVSSRKLLEKLSQWAAKFFPREEPKLIDGYEPKLLSTQLRNRAIELEFPAVMRMLVDLMGNTKHVNIAPMVEPILSVVRGVEIPKGIEKQLAKSAEHLRKLMGKIPRKCSTVKRNGEVIRLFDVSDIPSYPLRAEMNDQGELAHAAVICIWGIAALIKETFGLKSEGDI